VYLFQGKLDGNTVGGNVVASIGPDGILLVDDEYQALSGKLQKAIAEVAGPDKKIRFIVNTHWHKDHTEGNKTFGEQATIIAHEEVWQMLSSDQKMFGKTLPAYPPEARPSITFHDALTLHFNNDEIVVRHYPAGHTGGDSVVLFTKENVIHVGDLYIGPVFPFIDLDHGGNVVSLESDIHSLLENVIKPDTKLVPGHRAVATRRDLQVYDYMLIRSVAFVRNGMAVGKSQAELESQLPGDWKQWEWELLPGKVWLSYVDKSIGSGAKAHAPSVSPSTIH
jgi:glyoxylase-like metal-dependent hydrolase (beta-lactamase superfamily II)